jgi:hypothetical protein
MARLITFARVKNLCNGHMKSSKKEFLTVQMMIRETTNGLLSMAMLAIILKMTL